MPCDKRDKITVITTISRGTPKIVGKPPKARREARKDSPQQVSQRESGTTPPLTYDHQSPELGDTKCHLW